MGEATKFGGEPSKAASYEAEKRPLSAFAICNVYERYSMSKGHGKIQCAHPGRAKIRAAGGVPPSK